MGCCGGKSCKQTQSEEQMNLSAGTVVNSLLDSNFVATLNEIASAGIHAGKIFRSLSFKNPVIEKLVKQVTDLAIENAYMRSVFNFMAPMDVKVTDSVFTINFGPNHGYALQIPVTSRNTRSEIAKQLRAAAEQLEIESGVAPLSDQKVFSFVEQ